MSLKRRKRERTSCLHHFNEVNVSQCLVIAKASFPEGAERQIKNPDYARVIATHVPVPLLPFDVQGKNLRIVYVVRDVKDCLVSFWHFFR